MLADCVGGFKEVLYAVDWTLDSEGEDTHLTQPLVRQIDKKCK